MTQRIAPNNQLPATHFIEVYSDGITSNQQDDIKNPNWNCVTVEDIGDLYDDLISTKRTNTLYTVCLFRIRENKLPTKHNFNK